MRCFLIFILLGQIIYGQTGGTERISLESALETAVKNNINIIRARRSIDAARGKFWTEISPPRPELSLSHEFIPAGKGLSAFQERTLEISQSIEFPTSFFLKGARSNHEISALENELNGTLLDIQSDVKLAYFSVLVYSKKHDLAAEIFKIAKEFKDKSEIRVQSGEGTKLESITAAMQFNEAKILLESSANEFVKYKNDLLILLNDKQLNSSELILTDSISIVESELKLDELLSESLSGNPLIMKSGSILEAASVNKTLAWTSFLPNLNFSYYKQALPRDNNFYGMSFGISLPLWFMFEQRGVIEESAANYSIASEELKNIKSKTAINLKTAFMSFSFEQGQIKLYRKELIPQAEELFILAKLSYMSGEINYVEFLQAKQSLISVQNNYFNSLSNYFASLSALEKGVGKLIR